MAGNLPSTTRASLRTEMRQSARVSCRVYFLAANAIIPRVRPRIYGPCAAIRGQGSPKLMAGNLPSTTRASLGTEVRQSARVSCRAYFLAANASTLRVRPRIYGRWAANPGQGSPKLMACKLPSTTSVVVGI